MTFDELSPEAKEHALDKARDWLVDDDWWHSTYEYVTEVGALLGITVEDIEFSGFWSQGDGASFTGVYHYKPVDMEQLGEDETLRHIATQLTVLAVAGRLSGDADNEWYNGRWRITRQRGHYVHSGYMQVKLVDDGIPDDNEETEIRGLMRRFADWIYAQLEAEYDHLTSDETIAETLRDTQEFDEDGQFV